MRQTLRREMSLGGAIVTGLGSIIGTGAFVAMGAAAGMWGDATLAAVPIAAGVAMFNGLSSAYLAGRFPVAGGTYEYAYDALGPWWGFTAGWLFLLAKTASAGTAALGVALYLAWPGERRVIAVIAVLIVTGLVLTGLSRTTVVNILLVTITVASLLTFAAAGLVAAGEYSSIDPATFGDGLLPAVAFLFVAHTGYGRIATLGEEVQRPERTIPRAVVVTLFVAALVYGLVALGGRATGGARWGLNLEEGLTLADLVSTPYSSVVAIGAVTAMLGVLLNLVLGLSRVWLAMGRRRDMPGALSRLDRRSTPVNAIVMSAIAVLVIILIGDISIAWSFSAFTVLLYYGITNLSVLAIDRRRVSAWLGLSSCAFLSFFVPLAVWLTGAALLAIGLVWKGGRRV